MNDNQFEKIYEKTKGFGRIQFVREIQIRINDNKKLEGENKQLREKIEKLEQQLKRRK